MEPLIVYAEMSSAIANDAPHLDALLLYHACRRASVGPISSADPAASWEDLPPIPLARREIGGQEVSLCSSPKLLLAHGREVVERFAKRIDATAAAELLDPQRRTQICTTGTWTKSYYLPLRKRPALAVAWWCVGERDALLELLQDAPAIGKKIAHGHGRVNRWSVGPIDEDFSWFMPGEGGPALMRPLPWGDWLPSGLTGYRRDFGSCVPPYWHPERFGEIVTPC